MLKQAITDEGSDLNPPSLAEALTRHATRKRQTVDLLTLVFTKLLICCRFLAFKACRVYPLDLPSWISELLYRFAFLAPFCSVELAGLVLFGPSFLDICLFMGLLLCPLWALFMSTYFALYGPFLMPFIGLSLYGSSL